MEKKSSYGGRKSLKRRENQRINQRTDTPKEEKKQTIQVVKTTEVHSPQNVEGAKTPRGTGERTNLPASALRQKKNREKKRRERIDQGQQASNEAKTEEKKRKTY